MTNILSSKKIKISRRGEETNERETKKDLEGLDILNLRWDRAMKGATKSTIRSKAPTFEACNFT
jgi:hypothetical protein